MLAIDFLANIRIQIYRILRYDQRDIRPFLYQVSNRILDNDIHEVRIIRPDIRLARYPLHPYSNVLSTSNFICYNYCQAESKIYFSIDLFSENDPEQCWAGGGPCFLAAWPEQRGCWCWSRAGPENSNWWRQPPVQPAGPGCSQHISHQSAQESDDHWKSK